MKRIIAWTLVLVILCVSLVACGELGTGPQPSVSARDFNTRLANMSQTMRARELAEISAGVLNAHRRDFADLDGWYTATGSMGREVLRRQIRLDGRDFTVTLEFGNNNVSSVRYAFDKTTRDIDEILELYVAYVFFDAMGENLRITSGASGAEMEALETIEEANERLVEAIAARESIQLIFSWDLVTANGDEARMGFSFAHNPLFTGDTLAMQLITFRR